MYGLCPWVWSGRVGHNRPVLEYACAVWHPALTKEQTNLSKMSSGVRLNYFLAAVPVICRLVHFKCRHYVMGVANRVSLFWQIVRDESHILGPYIIFYQQSVTHFLLTDCDQQRHFRYSTRGLFVPEIPFCLLCQSIFNKPSSIDFVFRVGPHVCMNAWTVYV